MKIWILLLLSILNFKGHSESIYVSGEIESQNTQFVLMPLVPSFQGKLSELVEEGSKVEKGDFLMRADGSGLSGQIESQIEQLSVFKSTAEKKVLDLKIQFNQAQIAYETAKIKHKIAKVKAEVPLEYIGELAYKNNQLSLKNSDKQLQKSKKDLAEVNIKLSDNAKETELGITQRQNKLNYLEDTLAKFTINAAQAGYVIHATNWRGEKIQIGDQIQSGREVLSVSQKTDLQIVAWVNAIDIPKITVNSDVNIQFDAYMGENYMGQIKHISSGGEDKNIWGNALYYKVTIEPTDKIPENLLLGMSAMIEIPLKESI